MINFDPIFWIIDLINWEIREEWNRFNFKK